MAKYMTYDAKIQQWSETKDVTIPERRKILTQFPEKLFPVCL